VLVRFMGKAVLDGLDKVEAARKFKGGDGTDVSMPIMIKLNPKEVLKKVCVWIYLKVQA
jgi:hypothetical protein